MAVVVVAALSADPPALDMAASSAQAAVAAGSVAIPPDFAALARVSGAPVAPRRIEVLPADCEGLDARICR